MREPRHRRSSRVRQAIAAPVGACLVGALTLIGCSSSSASIIPTAAGRQVLSSGAACVKGTGPGVTASTVTLAITVVNLSGGSLSNATVGVPSAQVQEKDWNLVAQHINETGGAGCRKIQLNFYSVNPLDAAGAEQQCLAIANSHPFMALDVGALSAVNASNCIPTAKVAFASQYLTPDQLAKYYPYYLSLPDVPTNVLRNSVLGLNQLGYFTPAKGFKSLGVLYDTCNPALIAAERSALKEAGVPKSKIVYFNLGCPAGEQFTSASMEQAVLSFKSARVTDVTSAGANTAAANFTQVAAQQNYKPIYVLTTDLAALPNASGSGAPNPANLNGAVNVATDAWGEKTTPGFTPSGGTQKCNAIFTAAGEPTVYNQMDGYGGVACDYLWYVQGILNHATSLQSAKLPAALHAVGVINYSYPNGPVNYTAAPKGAPYGLSYWRPEYYLASCKCWHLANSKWNPPFK